MLEIGTSGSVGGEGGNILSYPATVQIAMCVTVPGLQRTMSIARRQGVYARLRRAMDARERACEGTSSRRLMVRCRPGTVTDTAFCTVPGQHCNMTPKSVMLQCARDTRLYEAVDVLQRGFSSAVKVYFSLSTTENPR